ncbi:serine protease [Xanthomonas campestris]|uniref:S1 family peptidase n=1 Tax=Xanthomonas campestris TaxID=339 RepID=UPI0032E402F8
MSVEPGVEILKTLWEKSPVGEWRITQLRALKLLPAQGYSEDYFRIANHFEFPTNHGGLSFQRLIESAGSTNNFLKQSIVPVVALVAGASFLRVIGTAFVISASGLVMTAAHVLLDPEDSGYGDVTNENGAVRFGDNIQMGVLFPMPPVSRGSSVVRFAPFQSCRFWGGWKESPLFHERDRVDFDTDVAICRLLPHSTEAYQPLNLSLRPVEVSEQVFAIGYAKMDDIPVRYVDGAVVLGQFNQDLYVSVGSTTAVHLDNTQTRSVSTPGPCFEFDARIPGKMSGSPILGGDGAVIRGVVSKSLSGERHAFGALFGPATHLPLFDQESLEDLMVKGSEGIPRIQGPGL